MKIDQNEYLTSIIGNIPDFSDENMDLLSLAEEKPELTEDSKSLIETTISDLQNLIDNLQGLLK